MELEKDLASLKKLKNDYEKDETCDIMGLSARCQIR